MNLKFVLISFIGIISFSLWANPARESRHGYFIVKKKELYFTEINNSTAPLYKVSWWNGKMPIPLCAVNLNSACSSVEISFERQIIINNKKEDVVFGKAIFTKELKSDLTRLKK